MIFGLRRPNFDPRPLWLWNDWLRELGSEAGASVFEDLPSFEAEDGSLVLRLEVPGLAPDDIDVQVHERTVTIRVERDDKPLEGLKVLRRERAGALSVVRTVTLPASADPDQCNAALKNGMLTLTFPQRARSGPRRIELAADHGRA